MTERILVDVSLPVAEALGLPRLVPVRPAAAPRLRTAGGIDLALLRDELHAAAADDARQAARLGPGIERLDAVVAARQPAGAATTSSASAPESSRTGRRRTGVVALVVVSAIAAVSAVLWFGGGSDDEPAEIPTDALPDASDAPPSSVVSTTAPPTTTVSPSTTDSTTTTTVTTTTIATVAVPNVVASSRADAVTALEGAGLTVAVEEIARYDSDPDTVIASEPVEGASLAPGDTVTLTVAIRPVECNDAPDEVPVPSFGDLDAVSEEAAAAIAWATAVGLIGDGQTFRPGDPMTRAVAVTILHRYVCEPVAAGAGETFTDVPPDAFFAAPVGWASAAGIVSGVGGELFGADEPVSRGAFITVVWRALGEPVGDAVIPFTDVVATDFHHDAVVWAYGEGLATGTTATTFSPGDSLDRVTTIVLFDRLERGPDPLVGS